MNPRLLRNLLAQTGEIARTAAFLFLYAAAYLPRAWAYAAADAVGWAFHVSPLGARSRRSMMRAFPEQDGAALARAWMARPYRDFINTRRIIMRREDPSKWRVEARNAPAELDDPNTSLIVAMGHFSREATTPLYLKQFLPKRVATVVAPLDRTSLSPRATRLRLQLGGILRGVDVVTGGEAETISVGEPGFVSRIVRFLRPPGAAILISPDSITGAGREQGHTRPFAGHTKITFALGTARLARLAQRPLVTCVAYIDERGVVIVEWGQVLPPPARDDASADDRYTSAMLDDFERAVGNRPSQYVVAIGDERRWRPAEQVWVDDAPAERAPRLKAKRSETCDARADVGAHALRGAVSGRS